MAKVFISYSRMDIEFAKRLTGELGKSDLDFWIDWEGIPPTVDWWREIEKGIEEADNFTFLISPDSVKSKVCGQEIDVAVKNGKRIIPIVVREIEWKDTPPQLGHLNYIFFNRDDEFDTAVKKLMTAIQTDYEWVATHRRLQVKALEWERNHKENSFLLRGKDLQDAELQLATNSSKEPHPTDLQREHIFASRKAADRQRRIVTGISIVGIIALAALAIFGFVQANIATDAQATAEANLVVAQTAQVKAEIAQSTAESSNATAVASQKETEKQLKISRAGELAALALNEKDTHFDLALLLALEGFLTFDNAHTQGALLTLDNSHPGLQVFLSGHSSGVNSVAFSSDGKLLASGGWDHSVILWDVSDSSNPHQIAILQEHTDQVFSVAFNNPSPNEKLILASGSSDDSVILWDVSNLKDVSPIAILKDHTGDVHSVAFSPGKKLLASGSSDESVILWDIGNLKDVSPITILKNQRGAVFSVAFSLDEKLLASGSNGGFSIWDISNPKDVPSLFTSESLEVRSVFFSPKGNLLATGTGRGDNCATLWNISDLKNVSEIYKFPMQGNAVSTVAISPDGNRLASGSWDWSINLWDISNPDNQYSQPAILSGYSYGVSSVAFSPDGTRLASSAGDKSMIMWDVSNPVPRPPAQLNTQVKANYLDPNVSTSPDRKILAAGNSDHTITLSDISDPNTPKPIATLSGHYDEVDSVAFSSDGKTLASGSKDHLIILWDVSDPQKTLKLATLSGHNDRVNSVAFNPDGKRMASGSSLDASIILWDVSDPAVPLPIAKLVGESYLAFSSDGKQLISGGTVWDVDVNSLVKTACQRVGRNFTLDEWTQYGFTEPYHKTCDQWPLGT